MQNFFNEGLNIEYNLIFIIYIYIYNELKNCKVLKSYVVEFYDVNQKSKMSLIKPFPFHSLEYISFLNM